MEFDNASDSTKPTDVRSAILPTSDGLDQPLPPTCVRFPDKYMCPSGDSPASKERTIPGCWLPAH